MTILVKDLAGADLRYADLTDADLSGADLRHARLHGACLVGANLSGTRLAGADLGGVCGLRWWEFSWTDVYHTRQRLLVVDHGSTGLIAHFGVFVGSLDELDARIDADEQVQIRTSERIGGDSGRLWATGTARLRRAARLIREMIEGDP